MLSALVVDSSIGLEEERMSTRYCTLRDLSEGTEIGDGASNAGGYESHTSIGDTVVRLSRYCNYN